MVTSDYVACIAAVILLAAVPAAAETGVVDRSSSGSSAVSPSSERVRLEVAPMSAVHDLVDFSTRGEIDRWRVVNDGVMGGLSRSRLVAVSDSTAAFEGVLSLENDGGFASIRRASSRYDMADASAIEVVVRGDGRPYQLRLRTNDGLDGIAYRATFDTVPGEWLRIAIPFDEFVASYRGRRVPGAPSLDPADVRQLGFLLADERPGPFRLEVRSVRARGSEPMGSEGSDSSGGGSATGAT